MNEALKELIQFLKDASPHVWSVLIKQVYVEAFETLAWAVGLLVLSLIIYKLAQSEKKRYDEEYADGRFLTDCPSSFLYWIVGLSGLISFGLFISAVKWFINPEFYAIRYLLDKLGG